MSTETASRDGTGLLGRGHWAPPAWIGDLPAAAAIARHWLALGARDRKFALTASLIPLNYLFLFLITVINGNQAPTALVLGDHGPAARAFVRALRSTDTFDLQPMTGAQAMRDVRQGRLVAMITIPSGFDRQMAQGSAAPVRFRVDNVESDFVDDLQRGMDLAVNRFAARDARRGAQLVQREHDLHTRAVPYIPYVMISIVVVALMVGGLFWGGVAAAREYEQKSIVDMIMAPRSRLALLLGMTAGTFLVAAPGGLLLLAIVSIGFSVSAVSWPEVALAWTLVLAVYSACGVLLGTALRQRNGLSGLAILLSIPMLSLSGAFYPVSWSSAAIRTAAKFFPTYYANALFEHAFYAVRTTPTSLGVDYGGIVVFLLLALLAAAVLMRTREEAT
jgi:ABC-2 type transport system permease protein